MFLYEKTANGKIKALLFINDGFSKEVALSRVNLVKSSPDKTTICECGGHIQGYKIFRSDTAPSRVLDNEHAQKVVECGDEYVILPIVRCKSCAKQYLLLGKAASSAEMLRARGFEPLQAILGSDYVRQPGEKVKLHILKGRENYWYKGQEGEKFTSSTDSEDGRGFVCDEKSESDEGRMTKEFYVLKEDCVVLKSVF